MKSARMHKLQQSLVRPLLVKKKENLLYLTGRSFIGIEGWLLVKKTGNIFFGTGLEAVKGTEKVESLKDISKYLRKSQVLEVEDGFTYAEGGYLKYKIPGLKLKGVRSPVDLQRAVKDEEELALVGKSMKIVEAVFGKVKKALAKREWTEAALAEFIKNEGLKLGAQAISFPPIVASGAHAAIPHHIPTQKKLKKGESVVIDFGFKYKNYCSDFTRTVFIKSVPKRMEAAYNQTEKAYKLSMQEAREGAAAERPYSEAVRVLAEKNLDKYFPHSLGHGTGLEIHEHPNLSPKSREILKNGMIFSIEPGVYLPKTGGVRIEDLVYLKSGKPESFISVPTGLIENVIE